MLIDSIKGEQDTVDLLLQIAGRTAVIVASALMVFFDKEPFHAVASAAMLLLEVSVYNIAAAVYGRNQLRSGRSRMLALIIGDILEASVVVGISGGYNSPFFAVFLFTMAEIAIYLGWRMASALIVGMNAVQVIATGVQIAALRDSLSSSFIASRFSRLLIVGLLFVILAEILRKEESARERATRTSLQIANLNSIFSQLGHAHMDIQKVFDTVLSAATTLDDVLFCAILRKPGSSEQWIVSATSDARLCTLETRISVPPELEKEPLAKVLVDPEKGSVFPCSKSTKQMIVSNLPTFSAAESGMLILGRATTMPLDEEDEAFLRALTMQSQLALHNALLFSEREEQIERLKAFKEIQNTFFASAAHELKTPLTVLGLLASALAMTIQKPTAQQKEMMETMNQNVARLQTLSANILATARLEAMDVVLNPQPTDMLRLSKLVVAEMETVFREKNLSVMFEPSGPWRNVWADPNRIREVVFNLLANAGKFAQVDSAIFIRFIPDGERATLSVCDQGKDIPTDETDKIFEKYYTGKDAGALAGTGLGLYITKRLVALHQGAIWVESGKGQTCFLFSLPLAREGESYE
jgi:signal transduction histidine kinase